jgi:hypothetical protein
MSAVPTADHLLLVLGQHRQQEMQTGLRAICKVVILRQRQTNANCLNMHFLSRHPCTLHYGPEQPHWPPHLMRTKSK